jgi:hypothetical protein
VNFERDTSRISFSGPTGHLPLPAAAQDRLSWIVQLMSIVRARDEAQPASEHLRADEAFALWVAGPQGDAGPWVFRVQALEPDGSVSLQRQAARRYDVEIQVRLGPPPQRRLLALKQWHDGSHQPPWEFWDPHTPLPTIPP